MEVKVQLNNLRTAPRKTRLVADLIRGKTLAQARQILSFTTNKSARNFLKLLNSAAASAKNDFKLDENNLSVSKVFVDEGPKLKRWHPMSRGRAFPIIKRTSHITLALSEINLAVKKNEKKENKEIKKPAKEKNAKIKVKNTKKKIKAKK
jgi:large subunit ribosomal protein L22